MNTTPAAHQSHQVIPLAWFSLRSGKIGIGKQPTHDTLNTLKDAGVTHIATVQTHKESALNVRSLAQSASLEWLWLPFEHSSVESANDDSHLHQYLHELSIRLTEGAHVYLHCGDSQTRCSLLFYALCHYCRIPSSSAYNALHSFDAKAANQLPRKKLSWAAQLGHAAPK